MKALSLKLKEDIFNEVENIIKKVRVSRNAYINEALHFYNLLNKRKLLKKKLHRESTAVYRNSLDVLEEMERLDDKLI